MLATVAIRRSPDDEGFDVVCRTCAHTSRLHPYESVLTQVRLFLSQHGPEPTRAGCRVWTDGCR